MRCVHESGGLVPGMLKRCEATALAGGGRCMEHLEFVPAGVSDPNVELYAPGAIQEIKDEAMKPLHVEIERLQARVVELNPNDLGAPKVIQWLEMNVGSLRLRWADHAEVIEFFKVFETGPEGIEKLSLEGAKRLHDALGEVIESFVRMRGEGD